MLAKSFLLLLAVSSLDRTKGAVAADCEASELLVMEGRCNDILQQAVKSHNRDE